MRLKCKSALPAEHLVLIPLTSPHAGQYQRRRTRIIVLSPSHDGHPVNTNERGIQRCIHTSDGKLLAARQRNCMASCEPIKLEVTLLVNRSCKWRRGHGNTKVHNGELVVRALAQGVALGLEHKRYMAFNCRGSPFHLVSFTLTLFLSLFPCFYVHQLGERSVSMRKGKAGPCLIHREIYHPGQR